jgi:hypothetical protein
VDGGWTLGEALTETEIEIETDIETEIEIEIDTDWMWILPNIVLTTAPIGLWQEPSWMLQMGFTMLAEVLRMIYS